MKNLNKLYILNPDVIIENKGLLGSISVQAIATTKFRAALNEKFQKEGKGRYSSTRERLDDILFCLLNNFPDSVLINDNLTDVYNNCCNISVIGAFSTKSGIPIIKSKITFYLGNYSENRNNEQEIYNAFNIIGGRRLESVSVLGIWYMDSNKSPKVYIPIKGNNLLKSERVENHYAPFSMSRDLGKLKELFPDDIFIQSRNEENMIGISNRLGILGMDLSNEFGSTIENSLGIEEFERVVTPLKNNNKKK